MKKLIKVEQTQCDFCENIAKVKCDSCGKDICSEHSVILIRPSIEVGMRDYMRDEDLYVVICRGHLKTFVKELKIDDLEDWHYLKEDVDELDLATEFNKEEDY